MEMGCLEVGVEQGTGLRPDPLDLEMEGLAIVCVCVSVCICVNQEDRRQHGKQRVPPSPSRETTA